MADLVPDIHELSRSVHLEDKQLFFLQCAMEENCLSSTAYEKQVRIAFAALSKLFMFYDNGSSRSFIKQNTRTLETKVVVLSDKEKLYLCNLYTHLHGN